MMQINPKPPLLECANLSKSYSSTIILDQFSLRLNAGEIGMLMGPSGCGKTTLLMMVGGILIPDKGACIIHGQNLFSMPAKQRVTFRAAHISFLFQHLHLFPALSALDNLALPLLIDGVSEDNARQAAKELMIKLGLELHIHSKLDILSGGQKQRIAMGRALIRAPDLVLCDEPTSNLDQDSTRLIFSIIEDYAKTKGCAFLISTHDYRITSFANTIVQFKGLNDCVVTHQ